ncbi:AAA family ATPase [Candidatus Enterovibrio altilux]|nr:AAA family ATPase [Candidatus Enterovibrio luxaltus]
MANKIFCCCTWVMKKKRDNNMTITIHDENIIALSEKDINENLASFNKEQILKGLFRGSIGFLIAPPDSGKSYLSLSIAYEMALPKYPLIGIGYSENKVLRTLIWPIEDSLSGILPRIKAHLAEFSTNIKERLRTNIGIYRHFNPICSSGSSKNTKEWEEASKALEKLIATSKEYDLVVIDTLRDAIGSADIVDDDYYIRITLEKLANEADVAVLVVHHPTKNVSRGKEIINSVSGSGLSSTLSKSKLHLYLDLLIDKKDNTVQETRLRHIKANYVPFAQQWRKPIRLHWSNNALLHVNQEVVSQLKNEQLSGEKKVEVVHLVKKRLSRLLEEPGLIHRDDSLLSEKSKRLAKQTTHGPFGEGMALELSEALFSNSNLNSKSQHD